MQDKTQKAYIVWSNTDLTEGRGYEYPMCICSKEATAAAILKAQNLGLSAEDIAALKGK